MAEEGEDVAHASFEHAAEGGEFPAAFVAPRSGQVVDQLAHHAFAASPVVAPVGVYDPLVGVVGEHEVVVGLDGEQGHESGTAACAEVFVAGQQGAPAVVEPVALDTAPAGGVALCFASMSFQQAHQYFSAVWADGFPRSRHHAVSDVR